MLLPASNKTHRNPTKPYFSFFSRFFSMSTVIESKSKLWTPIPLFTCCTIVKAIRPAISNTLFKRVNIINHLEIWFITLDGLINLFRVKAHRSDVETITMLQSRRVCLHQRDSCMQAIWHVHHIHQRAFLNRTDKLFTANSCIIDVHCIVCCTATRRCYIRNKTRETN